jgi:hypothetical protein
MAKFKCDKCEAEFDSDEKLAEHYKTHLETPMTTPGYESE